MIPSKRAIAALALALIVILSGTGAVAPVAADDDPPDVPAAYYGSVTTDGEPAPDGTEIVAEIDGEERGSIVTDEEGQYGGPGVADEKLTVEGTDDGEVTFLVDGVEADTDPSTVDWESGDVKQVDLQVGDTGEAFIDVEIDTDASTLSVEPNETATVVADLENTGDVDGASNATFELEGETLATEDERVFEDGESETDEYTVELAEEGEYDAVISTVDASDAVTIEVAEEDDDDDDEEDPPAAPPSPPDDEPENISVTEAVLSATSIDENESVDVTADLENTGEEVGEFAAGLEVDGEVVDSETVEVAGESEESVTFTETFEEPGEYEITVDGVEAGTLTVVEDDPAPPDISVVEASLTPEEIEPGETVDVDATLENAGEETGEATIDLEVDGEHVADETVEVDGGETLDVSFDPTLYDEGTYEVFVDDVEAGTVTVATDDDPADDDPVDDDPVDDGTPGFGGLIALAALFGASIILIRHRHP